MRKNWFENKLYSRLANKPADLDLDSIWEEIEAKRHPKNDRGFWLPILSGLLGLSLIWFLYVGVIKKDNNLIDQTVVSNSIAELHNGDKQETTKITERNKKTTYTNSIVEETRSSNAEKESKEQVVSQIDNTKNTILKTTVQPNEQTKNIASSKIKNQENIIKESKRDTKVTQLSMPTIVKQMTTASFVQDGFESNKDRNSIKIPVSNASSNTGNIMLPMLSQIQSIDLDGFKLPYRKYEMESTKIPPVLAGPGKFRLHEFGFSGSYGTIESDLQSLPTSLDTFPIPVDEMVSARNNNERKLDYFDLGLDYKMYFSPKLFIHTGLNFQQYTSRHSVKISEFSSEEVSDTIEIIHLASGDIQFKEGDVLKQTTTFSRSTKYQKYRSIRVPILLGTRFSLSDKWNISLSGGVSYGLSLFNSGETLLNERDFINFGTIEDASYRSSHHVDVIGRFDIQRIIAPSTYVSLGGKINSDLLDRTSSDAEFSHSLNSFNLSLGLYRQF